MFAIFVIFKGIGEFSRDVIPVYPLQSSDYCTRMYIVEKSTNSFTKNFALFFSDRQIGTAGLFVCYSCKSYGLKAHARRLLIF